MDKKIIKGLIDEKLEVIQEQFSIIKEYEGKIPIIEIDLLMTSIRDLYELVLSLQLENLGSVLPKPSPLPETQKVAPPPAPVIVEDIKEEIPEPVEEPVEKPVAEEPPVTESVAPVRLSPNILSMEPVTEEEQVKEEPPAPAPGAEQDIEQPHEKYQRITFDLFSDGTGSTLADRLREGQEKRIADKLQENKVIDLRTTIGINDKFLFINELFEGNMRIYDDAIQKLNEGTTVAQADMLLLDLKIVYNWDSESPTVKKFVELVRRRY